LGGERHSHPFDTALQAYSGQAVDLQEATSKPGIRVAEYCLVINHFSSAFMASGEIDSAPRPCCGLREKTPDPFKFYEVDALEQDLVNVLAIGIKRGNLLIVAGKEIRI